MLRIKSLILAFSLASTLAFSVPSGIKPDDACQGGGGTCVANQGPHSVPVHHHSFHQPTGIKPDDACQGGGGTC